MYRNPTRMILTFLLAGTLGQPEGASAQEDPITSREQAELWGRIHGLVHASKSSWSQESRDVLVLRLFRIVRSGEGGASERALAAVPMLLESWEPKVKPIFSGEFEKYNERFPLPSDLRDRETGAAIDVVCAVLDYGLRRLGTPPDQVPAIQKQLDSLVDEAVRLVRPRISGEGAADAIENTANTARVLLSAKLGDPFRLGVDRPLSQSEMDYLRDHIQAEAAKLDGLVISAKPRLPDLDERSDSAAYIVAVDKWNEAFSRIADVIGSAGLAGGLCHPEARAAIVRLYDIRAEYRRWREEQAAQSQAGSKERVEAALKEFERSGRGRARVEEPKEKSPSEPAPAEAARTGRSAAPENPSANENARWLVGILVLMVIVGVLIMVARRR